MFSRNIWLTTDVTRNCKALCWYRRPGPVNHARFQFQKTFHNRRSPQLKAKPLEHLQFETGPVKLKSLFRPLVFTIGVSTVSVAGCVIWEYENVRMHAAQLLRKHGTWLSGHQKKLSHHKSELDPIRKWWQSLRDSEKMFYPLLAANVLVFGAWRFKSLQPFMVKYFLSHPESSTKCLPMIFSAFSHNSPLHLAANMYVLYSFMPAVVASLGKEQFLAMYMSAAAVSSFSSFLYKVVANQPGYSLGASGAIMGVLSYVCMQYPDTGLSIILLPMYTFAAGTAIKVIMGVDLAGVLMGWKFFDHAAHLGGALFGIAWCYWGGTHIWANRDKFLQYYHLFRKGDSSGR